MPARRATSCASRSTGRAALAVGPSRPDGKITLPLIGDLDANNRTPIELDIITTSLKGKS
jgi:hypothetical protein